MEGFTPPPTHREATMYRRAMKERDFLEKQLYVAIFTRLPERELCALWTREHRNSVELCWDKKKTDGSSLHPRTILAYLCASVTRSISNMTSSSTVGYSGSFFPISCSIRWYNSTSYLQKNKKDFLITLHDKRSRLELTAKRVKVTLVSLV